MKITQVEVRVGETRSINFQSCTQEACFRAELEPGEEPEIIRLLLEELCTQAVHAAFDRREEARAAELIRKAEEVAQ